MTQGTLEIKRIDDEDWFVINADFETELMIRRLIPSFQNMPLRVRVHAENTRLIRMIMSEYPLEIKTKKWEKAQDQIKEQQQIAETLSKLEYVEPDGQHFIGTLKPFQKTGLDFMLKTSGNVLVTDEMGLGKTIETLAFISKKTDCYPIVIVAPLTTLINWKREIERFLRLDSYLLGSQKRLDDQMSSHMPIIEMIRSGKEKELPTADFYIINYDLIDRRIKDLIRTNPRTVVYDEIQYLRSNSTWRYGSSRQLALQPSVKYRIGLSGTPIYNKGIEMYNIIEVLKQGLLGDRDEFIRRYCIGWDTSKTTDEGKQGLSTFLRNSIMIRRKKADVLPDLPEKVKMKQTIPINQDLYVSELGKLFKKIDIARENMASATFAEEQKEGLFELNKKIREMRMEERQIAGLAKAPFVLKYLETLMQDYDEEKFVIFCHHISVHEILYQGLYRYNPVQIIGGQSDKQRQSAIDSFQNDKKTRAIICGLRAGNLGISLTASTYVIFAELDWSPSVHLQAEDRLHRIGQTKTVFAHYLEGENTFDEIISQILLNKKEEISNVLGDKMERLNNEKALQFLQDKYKLSQASEPMKLVQSIVEE